MYIVQHYVFAWPRNFCIAMAWGSCLRWGPGFFTSLIHGLRQLPQMRPRVLLIHGLRQLPQMRPRVLHPSPTNNASSHQNIHAVYYIYIYIYICIYIYIYIYIHKPCNAHFHSTAWDYPHFIHCTEALARSRSSSRDNSRNRNPSTSSNSHSSKLRNTHQSPLSYAPFSSKLCMLRTAPMA